MLSQIPVVTLPGTEARPSMGQPSHLAGMGCAVCNLGGLGSCCASCAQGGACEGTQLSGLGLMSRDECDELQLSIDSVTASYRAAYAQDSSSPTTKSLFNQMNALQAKYNENLCKAGLATIAAEQRRAVGDVMSMISRAEYYGTPGALFSPDEGDLNKASNLLYTARQKINALPSETRPPLMQEHNRVQQLIAGSAQTRGAAAGEIAQAAGTAESVVGQVANPLKLLCSQMQSNLGPGWVGPNCQLTSKAKLVATAGAVLIGLVALQPYLRPILSRV